MTQKAGSGHYCFAVNTVGGLRCLLGEFESEVQQNSRWFPRALAVVVALGCTIRVVFALSVWSLGLTADANFFHVAASNLAAGKGYTTAGGGPTAIHPPVFPCLLTLFDLLDFRSVGAQRVVLSVVVSAGILLIGLLGRKVAGAKVGIVSAVLVALNPLWVQPSGILMSESIYLVILPGILLLGLASIERPTGWRLGALGTLIAIATLIRSEAIDLLVLLAIPVILLAYRDWRKRLWAGLAVTSGFVLILTPWLVRNEIQLGGASLSTNGGVTLAGSYCPATFNPDDPSYGSFNTYCAINQFADATKPASELTINRALTTGAESFARDHLSDMPGVVLARERSVWGFGNQDFQLSLAVAEGRVRGYEQAGTILYWISLPFVIVGLAALAKISWKELIVIAAPLVVVAVNAAVFYGSTRMRTAAEPSLAVLTALGIVVTWGYVRSLRGPRHAHT